MTHLQLKMNQPLTLPNGVVILNRLAMRRSVLE